MNEANERTEKELETLERKIARLYRTAKKELKKEITDYFQAFKKKDEEKKAEVESGEITEEEYKQWRTREMASGVQYEYLRDHIARKYLEVNQKALEYVNDCGLDIYALNHNYEAYRLESIVNG